MCYGMQILHWLVRFINLPPSRSGHFWRKRILCNTTVDVSTFGKQVKKKTCKIITRSTISNSWTHVWCQLSLHGPHTRIHYFLRASLHYFPSIRATVTGYCQFYRHSYELAMYHLFKGSHLSSYIFLLSRTDKSSLAL